MTSAQVLVLAWLLLAHLVADFVLQTDSMVADKSTPGRRAWRGLAAHGGVVALCLAPFVAAYAERGLALLAVVTAGHIAIDRWKVRATRHAEAEALAAAHRRHQDAGTNDGLGAAWTPVPGALFVLDQLLHVALIGVAWLVTLAPVAPTAGWVGLVDQVTAGVDRAELHRWTLTGVVVASVVLVNVRAAALFVATLVRPREAVTGAAASGGAAAPRGAAVADPPPGPSGWRIRIGRIVATAEPTPAASASPAAAASARHGHASPERIGATIGIIERLLIVAFVLTDAAAAIGFVVGAKTLARFKQLDDRDFAEYYLLGTLASVAVAITSALLARAALASLG